MKFILLISMTIIAFLNLGKFLDVTTKPLRSDAIFCLGGYAPDRLITAISLLKHDYSSYNKLYFSGNKNDLDNVKDVNITYVAFMQNTMAEILYIDNLVEKEKYNSIIIVTDPPHSRRVSFMINQFTKNIKGKYIIVSSHPRWWQSSKLYFLEYKAITFSIREIGKLFYNYLKYTFKAIFDPKFVKRFNEEIIKNENSSTTF